MNGNDWMEQVHWPQAVRTAIGTLEGLGHECWAVGGCVRDAALSAQPHD